MTRSVSRTLEYSYNDFVIAQIASTLGGRGTDVDKYLERSANWQNLFKKDQTSFSNGTNTGFVGFFQPKYLNQTWGFQDPLKCSNIDTNTTSICSLQNNAAETFESSIWEYSLWVFFPPIFSWGLLARALWWFQLTISQFRTSRPSETDYPFWGIQPVHQAPGLPTRPEHHVYWQRGKIALNALPTSLRSLISHLARISHCVPIPLRRAPGTLR
jgi:hypothetical protein